MDGIAGPECSEIQDVVEASRIHSRRFREYCDQVIDKQIDELASFILSELNRFYQRQLQKFFINVFLSQIIQIPIEIWLTTDIT